MKKVFIALLAFTTLSAFANSIEVKVDGADAVRLIKTLRGFSNPELNGTIRTLTAKTQDAQLSMKCSSDLVGGFETNASCSVILKDGFESDRELKVTEAKKFKNLISVQILKGNLQAQLRSRLSLVAYQSVGTNMLSPREAGGRSGPYPVLKISCDNRLDTCEVQMNYKF